LKHHPDKKAGATGKTDDDSFFKCIQKAYEVLSDPVKRRQWDSVDPKFDESLPGAKHKGEFFEVFGEAFDKEARFSKSPVPNFGTEDSTREEVEAFYEAWFNFESWRTFEMLDEEEEGLGDSREEKRWLEKKNRGQRAKLKKEDNARVTRFVELAMKLDPRIQRIKNEEKAAKEAKKKEKESVAKQAEMDAARKAEEERILKEQEEKLEKERVCFSADSTVQFFCNFPLFY
jgi:DnaJ family protein C protein 2